MVNVVRNFKNCEVEDKGVIKIVELAGKPWNVMDYISQGEEFSLAEGGIIEFVTTSGELKRGSVEGIAKKGEKTEIMIVPEDKENKEIWCVSAIQDGTLKVIG